MQFADDKTPAMRWATDVNRYESIWSPPNHLGTAVPSADIPAKFVYPEDLYELLTYFAASTTHRHHGTHVQSNGGRDGALSIACTFWIALHAVQSFASPGSTSPLLIPAAFICANLSGLSAKSEMKLGNCRHSFAFSDQYSA